MKRIINGKLYTTESSTRIAEFNNGLGPRDFRWLKETLLKTKSGTYLLHGAGGGLSPYAEACGQNSWTDGESLLVLTPEEVMDWAERRSIVTDVLLAALAPHLSEG